MSALVRSVNVGRPREAAWAEIGRTSIDKRPLGGQVRVGRLGLEGDEVSDTRHHGGPDQAVYAFAREDLDTWEARLGREIRDGQFGENLTTEGIDVNDAEIGEHWRIGTAVLEIVSMRTPCNDFRNWMGESGYDRTAWVRRFTATNRPGPYFRVLEEGVRCRATYASAATRASSTRPSTRSSSGSRDRSVVNALNIMVTVTPWPGRRTTSIGSPAASTPSSRTRK